MCILPSSDNSDSVAHFLASVNEYFEDALRDVNDSDMVRMITQNQVNQNDKPIGISFRLKEHLSGDVIWSVCEILSQSNSRFNSPDMLAVTVYSVRMRVGFGKYAIQCRRRPLSVMAHLKKRIVEVKADDNCLVHALLIAIAKLENDPNYKSYPRCRKIRHVVKTLLQKTGIDLANGAGISELFGFREHFHDYKIFVYHTLHCGNIV